MRARVGYFMVGLAPYLVWRRLLRAGCPPVCVKRGLVGHSWNSGVGVEWIWPIGAWLCANGKRSRRKRANGNPLFWCHYFPQNRKVRQGRDYSKGLKGDEKRRLELLGRLSGNLPGRAMQAFRNESGDPRRSRDDDLLGTAKRRERNSGRRGRSGAHAERRAGTASGVGRVIGPIDVARIDVGLDGRGGYVARVPGRIVVVRSIVTHRIRCAV
jgi:hypothetical protein